LLFLTVLSASMCRAASTGSLLGGIVLTFLVHPRRKVLVPAVAALVTTVVAGLLAASAAGAGPADQAGAVRDLRSAVNRGQAAGLDRALWAVAGLSPVGRSVPAAVAAQKGMGTLRDKVGRVIVNIDGADRAALGRAVQAAGGVVTGAVPGKVRASVPASSLVALASAPGVTRVRQPVRPVPQAVTSEGVAQSGADAWHAAGKTGAGVKVGIIDIGFGGLSDAQAAGDLPADVTVQNEGCPDVIGPAADVHGTAVAEIVHDMAPDAQLFLVCIVDDIGFSDAETYLRGQGVAIINASLSFYAAGRGDGSGSSDSPAGVVRRSRQAGILWTVSAGNDAQGHVTGITRDQDNDGWVNFTSTDESENITVPPGGVVAVYVTWDAWPTTHEDFDVYVTATNSPPTDPSDVVTFSTENQSGTPGGLPPAEFVLFDNPTAAPTTFFLWLDRFANAPTNERYDMTVLVDFTAIDRNNPAGSIGEPASSPYAFAAGAACWQTQSLQPYSSRGPTIDGRVKPDITGYDATTGFTFGGSTGCDSAFTGTSAAAPHLAGAAALVKGANSALDAGLIQGILTRRATDAGPAGVDNGYGAGLLTMGSTETPAAPAGDTFVPRSGPLRVLDTRAATGGHQAPLGPAEEFALPVRGPGLAPDDATAVVVNVTGTGPTTGTFLSVYPERYGGTSSVNLVQGQTAANLVVATVGPDGTIRLRNAAGQVNVVVDLVGWFVPAGGDEYVGKNPPTRVLDTRTTTGGHNRAFAPGETFRLPVRGVAGVPAEATSVVVNITGTGPTLPTYLSVFPEGYTGSSNLNLAKGETRANLVVSRIGADGRVGIRNAGGTVNVIADVVGWLVADGGGRYVALDRPRRVLDTRSGNGLRLGPLGATQTLTVDVAAMPAVPANASALVTNLTGTAPTMPTFLTAYPAGVPFPGTSNVNLAAGRTAPDAVFGTVGTLGRVVIRNANGSVQVILDLTGYFTAP
jgi:Subtilase family